MLGRWPRVWIIVCLCCVCFAWNIAQGQSQTAAEWTTDSFNPQRDAWQRNESKFTVDTVKNIRLLWKLKTDNKPMGMQSFREPQIIAGVDTKNGTQTLAILAGSSNDVYAIDADSGKLVWQKHLKWASNKPQKPDEGHGFICNDALTATPVVTPAGAAARFLYVLTGDGYLHTLTLSTGAEQDAPIQMLPNIYGKAYGLNLRNDVVYTTTGQGCNGVPNELYAVDLKTRKAFSSTPPQGGIFGTAGAAIGRDGTLYFATGDGPYNAATGRLTTSVEAYTSSNDTLTLKDYYTPINREWLTDRDLDMGVSPVVFPYKGRDLVVSSGKEGRYYLLDSNSLGGANHSTPLYRTPLISNTDVNFQTEGTWGSLTSWKAQDGTRWVLAPIGGPVAVNFPISYGAAPNGGIIAMKLNDSNGKLQLTPAWLSRDMVTAEPPAIANGVVFVLAAGEFTGQTNDAEGGLYGFRDRIKRSVPATLYALDAETGKELYSSGKQVHSFLHQSGIAVAGGRLIFGTYDGTIYCFGLK